MTSQDPDTLLFSAHAETGASYAPTRQRLSSALAIERYLSRPTVNRPRGLTNSRRRDHEGAPVHRLVDRDRPA